MNSPRNSPILCRHQLSVLQFNSIPILPGVSIILHSLRVQSRKLRLPTNLRCQFTSPGVSDWPALNQRFPWPPPKVWTFAKMAHRTQENSLFTRLVVPCERIQFRNRHIEEIYRASYVGRDMKLSYPLQACYPSSTSTCSPAWKFSESCTLMNFYEGFIT